MKSQTTKYITYRQRSVARRTARQKRTIGKIIFTICLISMLIFGIVNTASAKEQPDSIKMVTTITVEYGDTLWSIAEEFYTDDFSDISSYIEEIKDCNQLFDENIMAGECLIIPYYIPSSSNF